MHIARENPDLRYLQHTAVGADYLRQITAAEADRHTRSAFQDLALTLAPPGGRLFDFGAGPGIDARFFAERGFTVDAYDADPRMREFFTHHCRDLIDMGHITLEGGAYRDFLAHGAEQPGRCADLVISNFAPLNLIDDLRELFVKFAALTGPEGKVLASVLNPYLINEMHHRWWWRGAARLWRDGERFMQGPQAPHYRRLLRHFGASSAPHFRMSRLFRGLPTARTRHAGGIDLQRRGGFAWPQVSTCRYMFLLFEKTQPR